MQWQTTEISVPSGTNCKMRKPAVAQQKREEVAILCEIRISETKELTTPNLIFYEELIAPANPRLEAVLIWDYYSTHKGHVKDITNKICG